MSEGSRCIGTGIMSGLLSGLCCITPLILVLLGLSTVSGAMGIASFLQQNFRWTLFIPLGLIFLISSIYLYIKKKEGICNLDSIRRYKFFVISTFVLAIVVWALTIYLLVPTLFSLLQ